MSVEARLRARGSALRATAAAVQLELAVRNVRVLSRAAVRAVELEPSISPRLPAALRELAAAVRGLEHELDQGGSREGLRVTIVGAAASASLALDEPRGFAIDVLVGQLRSLATDLLRAPGLEQAAAVEQVRAGARGARRQALALPALTRLTHG